MLRSIFFLLFSLLLSAVSYAQQNVHHERIMFWNVENAFWPEDDPSRDDDEFTPQGTRHWTQGRLRQKLLQLTRVLISAGQGHVPMLVGLAEVEGDSVMHYWTHSTPLYHENYRYVVTHGPDTRGIQTALLYQPYDFALIEAQGHDVPLPQGTRPTRQILHATGRLVSGDTLDVLVCHLPSRMGGARQSQPARDAAHRTLMHLADSLRMVRSVPQVIIMGDMNDYPSGRRAWWGSGFVNLMLPLQRALARHPSQMGSHKYQGEWGFLDQFIVNTGFSVSHPRVFAPEYILTDDDAHLGHRPMRSYYGYTFEGGYSDHLPILLDIDIYF